MPTSYYLNNSQKQNKTNFFAGADTSITTITTVRYSYAWFDALNEFALGPILCSNGRKFIQAIIH